MGNRKPLSGWRGDEPDRPEVWWHPPLRLSVNPHSSPVPWGGAWFGADGVGMVWLPFVGDADTVHDAQLAAEDAARAMVADMAEALGGRVTWGESELAALERAASVAATAAASEGVGR